MIIDLQRRIAEIGRIRIGQQVDAGNGRTRPEKLATFRLTGPDRARIEDAAAMFGGQPRQWSAPAGQQWEVITAADSLNVIVPPADMAFSQHYELWSAGGCQRRCDGAQESISDGPCLCDPDARECDIHTRLSVLLRDLPGLGVWRIDTSGYYAAVELQGAVEVIRIAAGRGQMLPARLRLEQRQVKRPGEPVKRFAVPVLDIEVSPGQLLGGGEMARQITAAGQPSNDSAPAGATASLTPVPETVPHHPVPSVAEQAAHAGGQQAKPRRNAAQDVPATGLQPRTTAQAAQDSQDGGPDRDAPGSITRGRHGQLTKLWAVLTGLGYGKDEAKRCGTICEIIIGRDLTGPHTGEDGNPSTTKNLSFSEASKLIDTLEGYASRDALEAGLPGLESKAAK